MSIAAPSTSDYAKQYTRRQWVERDGSVEEVGEAMLAELEAEAAKVEIPKKEKS